MEIQERRNLITDIFKIYKEILILRSNVEVIFNYYDNIHYNILGYYNFSADKITIQFILRGRVLEALNDNIIEEFKDNINKVKLRGMHK